MNSKIMKGSAIIAVFALIDSS
jgi:hypothetical protein